MRNLENIEKRRYYRVPVRMPLQCRNSDGSVFKVYSINITPYGAQIESENSMSPDKHIELWPDSSTPAPGRTVKGKLKWTERSNGKFRLGVAFDRQVNWQNTIPPEGSEEGDAQKEHGAAIDLLNSVLRGVEDGVIILDDNLNIIAANPAQPFCPRIDHSQLSGCSLANVSTFLNVETQEGRLGDILRSVLETGEEKRLCCRCGTDLDAGMYQNYDIWIKKTVTPGNGTGLILRARKQDTFLSSIDNVTDTDLDEEGLWLKYHYVALGQLFDGLIEDIVNPISAAVGRLDLLSIKMQPENQEAGIDKDTLTEEIKSIQNILMQVTEFCRAAIRRRKDTSGTPKLFSINTLIEDELHTLELHTQFRNITKKIDFEREMPLIEGDYSDWVNAFVALCHAITRKVSTLQHKKLEITTKHVDGRNILAVTHNGKALTFPLENDPSLVIFKLLRQKYGVTITSRGTSGNQTIEIGIPAADRDGHTEDT